MSFSKENPSFCMRPFLQYSSFNDHKFRLCCTAKASETLDTKDLDIRKFFNSDYMKRVRQNLVQGRKISECESCYKIEEAGAISDRMESNGKFEQKFETLINQSVASDFAVDRPRHLDLRVGNTCNLKCQTCFSNLSVGLYDDIVEIFKDNRDLRGAPDHSRRMEPGFSIPQILEVFEGVESLKIIGGEPLLSPHATELLNSVVSANLSKETSLELHSNLTVWNSEFLKNMLQFKDVTLGLSLDGVGAVNDYMRYPSKWDEVKLNLIRFLDLADNHENLNLKITPVIQVTNAFSIVDLLKFLVEEIAVVEREIDICHIVLSDPAYHSLIHAPVEFKRRASENFQDFFSRLQTSEAQALAQLAQDFGNISEYPGDIEESKKFLRAAMLYEGQRPSSIRDVFPQVSQLEEIVRT